MTERIEDAEYRIPYRFGSVFLCVYVQGYKFHYNVKKDNFFQIFIVPKRRTITVPVTFLTQDQGEQMSDPGSEKNISDPQH